MIQPRLETFEITRKGMKANELLDYLEQQRMNEEEMKKAKEETNDLLRDVHEEEKVIRKEKNKTKERQPVMTTDVPIHGSWKEKSKEKNIIAFLSVNVNNLAHWS